MDRYHGPTAVDKQPELDQDAIRRMLREALAFYSAGPDQEALQQSVQTIREMMPVVHRLVLLDDLLFIAEADGEVNDNEKEMIDNLSQSWGVSTRVDGEVDL